MTDSRTKIINHPSSKVKRTATNLARKFMLFCFVILNAFAFNICEARNPEMVTGLSVEVLNYAKAPIHFVKLNGEVISGYVDAAKVGEAKGGGISCCSGAISARRPTAEVTIETKHETYTTQADVELPFPDIMDTLMVHVLPGHKVVIEVVPGSTRPRQDLMNAQIKALGLRKEESDSYYMRSERPKYTGYYKPD